MSDYVIISDATLDLPMDIIKQHDIHVIPMTFTLNDVSYTHYPDEREISIPDFYKALAEGGLSQSSQIPPIIYQEFMEEFLKQGKDIYYIAFSSGLSGTYNSGRLVMEQLKEKYPNQKILCTDTLCASVGEGLLVLTAAKKKEAGYSIDELHQWVEENRLSVMHWFTVKDLFYLKRGGRLSSLEALVGTALKIRPVLTTDEEGKLVVYSKIRGSKKELEFMLNALETQAIEPNNQTIIIAHSDNLEQAKALEQLILEKNLVKEVIISQIGPIIGTHTGPGMLALTFFGNKPAN